MIEKLKALNRDAVALFLLALIGIATHIPWVFSLKNFTSGDWWYIGVERYKDFLQFSPIWVSNNLGSTSATPHFYVVRFFEAAANILGATFAVNQKLFYFLPIVLLSLFGAYWMLRMYFVARFAFLGAVVYGFNTIFLFNQVGALTIEVVFAFAPLSIYLFRRLLERPKSGRLIFANSVLLAIMVAYELRITLLVLGVLFGLLAYNALFRTARWQYFWRRALSFFIVVLLVLALNSFWILPIAFNTGSSAMAELAGRGLFVSFSDVLNGLTLYHPFWTGERPSTFVSQPIPFYAWLVPIFAFLGFVIRPLKAHREMFFWGVVTLGGIFLVKQVNEPFLLAYPWLYEHIPGFGAFRESSKFYLFVALSYAVLIPFSAGRIEAFLVGRVPKIRAGFLRYVRHIGYAAILALFLWNAAPFVTGSFRTMILPHDMPADYAKLNNYIDSQKDYFRTLWVPVNSRWATDTNNHPNLVATQVFQGQWLSQLGDAADIAKPTLRDKITNMLLDPSTNDFLRMASIKYVIVPLRDTQSEDDFFKYYGDDRDYYLDRLDNVPNLKRIDLGLSQIAVYENANFSPYITASNTLTTMPALKELDDTYSFITKGLGDNFTVMLAKDKQPAFPSRVVTPLFEEATSTPLRQDIVAPAGARLYAREEQSMRLNIQGQKVSLYGKADNRVLVNGNPVSPPAAEQMVGTATLPVDGNLYIQMGNELSEVIRRDGDRSLGAVSEPVALYATEQKQLITNPTFEQGLWQKDAKDCNNYDGSPQISMQQATDGDSHSKVLQFKANKHTACTETQMDGTGQPFLLSFDYKVEIGDKAGYEVTFNDPPNTTIRKEISANARWQTYRQVIVPPAGATKYTLRLMGYPDYRQRSYATTSYDNVEAMPLNTLLRTQSVTKYTPSDLPAADALSFTYPSASDGTSDNLIPNGDFGQGLWQKKVGDCNQYDDQPVISMKLTAGSGANNKALQLEARRHAACTQTSPISVQENSTYLFSFDYQSPNSKRASYYISFDDPSHTVIKGDVSVKNHNWNTFSRQIKAPLDATQATVFVYAYSDAYEQLNVINRYDNFALRHIPDVQGRFYVVQEPAHQLQAPNAVTFETVSATKKLIHIKGASTPFYLHMAEAYHPAWELVMNNSAQSPFGWLPFAHPNKVASVNHYSVGDVTNGWYVDTTKLCKTEGLCHQNSDGSYDIELAVDFSLQRWVYAGLVITCTLLLVGGACFLVKTWRIHQRRKRDARLKADLHVDEPDGVQFVPRAAPPLRVPQRPGRRPRPKRRLIQ